MPSERVLRRARRGLAVGCLVAAGVAVTGCMELTTSVTVRDDRSAQIVIEAYPDSDTLIEAGGEQALDQFIDAATEASSDTGVRIEKLEDRRIPGVRITSDEVSDAEQLALPIQVPGGPTLQWFNRFELSSDDKGWTLDAELAPLPNILAAIAGSTTKDLGDVDYEVRVSLPGHVVSTNATERDGSTAIWEVDAGSTQPWRLSAQTETGLQVSPILLLVVGVVAVVVVGIVLVISGERWSVRRRIRRESRSPSAASTWGPASGTGLPAPGVSPARGDAPAAAGHGLYSDQTGDTSVALPVGGAAWGPPPPPTVSPPQVADRPAEATPAEVASSVVAPTVAAPTDSVPTDSGSTEPPSPPEPTRVRVVAPGWYPDPYEPSRTRFWDGTAWTDHTA